MTKNRIGIAALIASLCASAGLSAAQNDATTPPAPTLQPKKSQATTMAEHVEQIKADVQRLRELEYTNDRVPVRRQKVGAFRRQLEQRLDRLYPPDRREGIVEGLARLGMIDRGLDLKQHLIQAHLVQAAAYYDPQAQQVNFLVQAMPIEYMRTVLANRLAKALIDQHFDVDATTGDVIAQMNEWPRPQDKLIAAEFLTEGEPAYLQMLWQFEQMGAPLNNETLEEDSLRTMAEVGARQLTAGVASEVQRLTQGGRNANHPVIKAMLSLNQRPLYILEPMYAAQMKGAYFVSVLKRGGGWELVARAHREPPVSTEQTLHPKKLYWEQDQPTEIKLPMYSTLRQGGWELIDSAVHGELMLRTLLSLYEAERFDAMSASAGWDGDVYQAWRSRDGRVGIILATTWDTENDAMQFFESYVGILGAKYPQLEQKDAQPNRLTYECGGGAQYGWGWLVRRGREVFAIEGFTSEVGEALLEEALTVAIEHVQ